MTICAVEAVVTEPVTKPVTEPVTEPVTTVTTVTTTTVTTLPVPPCEKTLVAWNELANSQVFGGVNNASACSVAACQEACERNTSCSGVDWDPAQSVDDRCWLHGPWSGDRVIGSVTGVTHYDINRTDICPSTFIIYSLFVRWK